MPMGAALKGCALGNCHKSLKQPESSRFVQGMEG